MILRNHGLLTTGRSVPEAFQRLYRLERSCQVQVDASSSGELSLLTDNVARASADGLNTGPSSHGQAPTFGGLEFPPRKRKMDKIDPSYRN